MKYKVYTKTEIAWDAMILALKNAKSSIFFEIYTFIDDTKDSHDFIEVLKKKASSGVKVKMIIDSIGSRSGISSETREELKKAGLELYVFQAELLTPKRLFRSTHRKILIIDEQVAFLGGVNIRKAYKKWDDLMIKIEGKITKYILKSFARVYKECGGKDELVLKYDRENLGSQKEKVRFFEHFPPGDTHRLKKYYTEKIENARRYIFISTPYFMPTRWFRKAIKRASERGVKIDILIPRVAVHPWVTNIPNYLYIHKLYKHGINFFLTKEMNHSKLMLVDGNEGVLGSHNVDILSFDFDMESGVFFTEPKLVEELNRISEGWKRDAVLYHPGMRDINFFLFDRFLDILFNSFEYAIKIYNRILKTF